MAIAAVAFAIGLPALAFTLWPLWRRTHRDARTFLPLPPDAREQLLERKRQALAALRELEFEHDAGHVSDDDFAELKSRYEVEAATVLTELDRLGGAPKRPEPRPRPEPVAASRAAWRHPLALAAAAVMLVVFGVALGAGIVRYTEPDRMAGAPAPGSRPLATLEPAAPPSGGGSAANGGRALSPEMLRGMLQAARGALFEGRYSEAIAAYQAVLKRDPNNVDAITHLGLIVAVGGHIDDALGTLDRALAIDPNYPAALLYRGQVLYEGKGDAEGAIHSWQKFLAVAPPGEDRTRVEKMIAEARAKKK